MQSDSVPHHTQFEDLLYDAGLVRQVPRAEMYDIAVHNFIQRSWQSSGAVTQKPDVQNPADWDDKLHACVGGEFFLHALEGCRRVLDVGCGEGWPSLYLARGIPEVVGLDALSEQVALAQNAARLLRVENVRFEVGCANDLPFEDEGFDGLCFGGNVLYHRSPPEEKLREFARVLCPGGQFVFELAPTDPNAPFSVEAMPLLDIELVPILYSVRQGLYSRSYLITLDSDSEQAKWLADLVPEPRKPYGERRKVCREIVQTIRDGALDVVEKVLYGDEVRCPTAGELPQMLHEAGFTDVRSWMLPDAVTFAQSLQQSGTLTRLRQEDLVPCLRALVAGTVVLPGWAGAWVTCSRM
jgi:ubiquinone/menaquinone biosynthesis C-methylase UbiE